MMDTKFEVLGAAELQQFQALRSDAINAVTERFYSDHASTYAPFGPAGRDACREDVAFHLEFLRPVLEFGILQPMVDYLLWLDSVLVSRAIPSEHLALSLDLLAEFFQQHMAPVAGAKVVAALVAARGQFTTANGTVQQYPPEAPPAWPEADAFEAALLTGDHRAALAIMNTCLDNKGSLVEFEMHVIQPALYRIGEKWQNNQVTVAQEHLASAIVQTVMTGGLLRSAPPPALNKRVLLACVEGNNHAIGLRMVADAFQLSGWDVQYLGANVPLRSLMTQIGTWKPDLVGLSVSFPQQLHAVKAAIALMVEHFGNARPPVIVGGLAINRFRQLADAVGADTCGTNAQTAVTQAEIATPPARSTEQRQ
jgi:methanogenic corrinoid protein MtbC1